LKIIILAAFAFVLGSVPTGPIIAKLRGLDLRKTGSGNIGATNVLRSAGKWPALFTLIGDILKGVIAAAVGRHFLPGHFFYEGVVGLCAILGHDFSVFLGFRGGKGVATGIGVLSIYSPQTALLTIIIWLMTAVITRYSSLGALVSFGLLPVGMIFFDISEKLPVAFMMTALVFIRHKDNISRLLKGQEPKMGKSS
jgi:glycerol-3-phosphate acyltransferase PlsY